MNLRLLRMGLSTLLNIRKQGFFIPYRYADTMPPSENFEQYPALFKIFENHKTTFESYLEDMAQYSTEFSKFGSKPPPFPRWEQDWFPRLDGAAAYTMVRKRKPAHIIEVGSGHSTRFMMQAVLDEGISTKITAIDPAPRADIAALPITFYNSIVQNIDPRTFDVLQAGDILFIDSSHIAMPGTDVDYLFLNILPKLPSGVLVHIHDIFLPFGYPKNWEWRGYNEQQIVAPLLLSGFKPIFSSAFVAKAMPQQLADTSMGKLPLSSGAYETSLWLEKTI